MRWRISGMLGTVWGKWLASKYATLIHVSDPIAYDIPFTFPKKDGRTWVVLDASLEVEDA